MVFLILGKFNRRWHRGVYLLTMRLLQGNLAGFETHYHEIAAARKGITPFVLLCVC